MTWRIFETKLLRETRRALARIDNGKTAPRRTYDTSSRPYNTGIYIVGISKQGEVYVISYYDDQPLTHIKRVLVQEGYIVTDPHECASARPAWMIYITPK